MARVPLEELTRSFETLSGDRARMAYARSADAAGQLYDRAGGAGVVALLRDIARGVPLTEAFERRLLMPYSAFVGSLDPAR